MPNRIIRESALTSATLYRLSGDAERLFWRMTLIADDYGRFEAEPQVLKAKCFPLWPDKKMSALRVATLYRELEEELVKTYIVGGKLFGFFVTWERHQNKRAKNPKYPEPLEDNLVRASASTCLQMQTYVPEKREARSETREARSEDAGNSVPPTGPLAWGSPEALIERYNSHTPDETPAVVTLSPERMKKAREYLVRFPKESFWLETFGQFHKSRFLRGLTPPRNGHKSFKPDFDWLLSKGKEDQVENCVKVHDGRYLD